MLASAGSEAGCDALWASGREASVRLASGRWGQTPPLQLQPGCIRVAWAAAVAGIGAMPRSGDSGETNTDFSDCPPPGERGPAVRGRQSAARPSVIQHQFCVDGRPPDLCHKYLYSAREIISNILKRWTCRHSIMTKTET